MYGGRLLYCWMGGPLLSCNAWGGLMRVKRAKRPPLYVCYSLSWIEAKVKIYVLEGGGMVMRKTTLNLDFRFNVGANLSRGGGEGGTPVAHDRPKFVNSRLAPD